MNRLRHSLFVLSARCAVLTVVVTLVVNLPSDAAPNPDGTRPLAVPTRAASTGGPGGGGTTSQFAPSGCNSGNFCSYNQGNGGSLCFQTNTDTAYWPVSCADQNDSAFDNSSTAINLYWGWDYSDAYFHLCANCYLLYMTQNYFNQCPGGGTSCPGYGQAMYDNVESSKFT